MPEKKRPALTEKPWPSEVVWMKASSIDKVLSLSSAMLAAPRRYGSMLAAKPSSLSPRLKPRVPGPMPASDGSWKPVSAYFAGSCEVWVYRPERISDIEGLKALAPPPADDATSGAATGAALAVAAAAGVGGLAGVAIAAAGGRTCARRGRGARRCRQRRLGAPQPLFERLHAGFVVGAHGVHFLAQGGDVGRGIGEGAGGDEQCERESGGHELVHGNRSRQT